MRLCSAVNKKIYFDSLLLDEWQKSFNLKYDWEAEVSAVIAGTYSLSLLAEEVESGYYLAEQELIINEYPALEEELFLKSEIISEREFESYSYLKLRSAVTYQDNILIVLNSKLIKFKDSKPNPSQKSKYSTNINSNKNHSEITFSKQEVERFAALSGDLNSIHLNSEPVVQGMLILLIFEDILAQYNRFAEKIKIKYFRKNKVDQKIKLFEVENSRFLALLDNKISFEIKIKEN